MNIASQLYDPLDHPINKSGAPRKLKVVESCIENASGIDEHLFYCTQLFLLYKDLSFISAYTEYRDWLTSGDFIF